MSIGDVYRLTIKGVVGADDNQNVLHFQNVGGGGTPAEEAEALANAFDTGALTEYLACLSSTYSVNTLSVRGVTVPTAGFDLTVTGNGAIAGEVSPTQTSALMNIRTAKFGRSYMGKSYLPALAEASVSNGSILAGHVTLIDAYFNALQTLVGTTPVAMSIDFGVYSRALNEFNGATTYFVSQFAATQRRRKPGVGS